jgi:hypothetical protein
MDGSKMANKPFVGCASVDIIDGISWKFGIAKIASKFTAAALAVGETIDVIEKIDSEQNFVIFSDSEGVIKGIGNASRACITSHITQMLKDKIERPESRGKTLIFMDPRALWSLSEWES